MHESGDVRAALLRRLRGVNAFRALTFGSCLAALAPGGARAAEPAPRTIPMDLPAALPAALAAAKEAGIPTDRSIAMAGRPLLHAGDFVAAVVSVREGQDLTQWILKLTVDDLTEAEKALPPLKEMDLYTSVGTHFHFSGRRAAIDVDLIGPFASRTSDSAHQLPVGARQRKRVLVNADYLGFGLDRACEAMISLREAVARTNDRRKFDYQVGAKPFSPDRVQAMAPFAREIGLTMERERAMFGAGLALPEFLRLIIKTPGLQDILQQVVEVSWWSVIRKGGKLKPGFQPHPQTIRRMPPAQAGQAPKYEFPLTFTLNRKPALECCLIVMEPIPPLAASAGVIAVGACRPDGAGARLTIGLLAARPGAEAKPADPPGSAAGG